MNKIIQLSVDLEHPEEAKFAIDEAVKAYEESKRQWTLEEISKARSLALDIMRHLCEDDYSITWGKADGCISVWCIAGAGVDHTNGFCMLDADMWNTWVAKCVALCIATSREVPNFIMDKAGECW